MSYADYTRHRPDPPEDDEDLDDAEEEQMSRQLLHDSTLVQWRDGDAWHRGRIVHNDDAEPIRDPAEDRWLVRHSYTGQLEMVEWGKLVVQSEEHPD